MDGQLGAGWDLALVVLFVAAAAAVPWAYRLRLRLPARRRSPVPPPSPDPFDVLRLQIRLGVVADELRALDGGRPGVYARAHRIRAARAAYDDLLEEACRLAGVPLDPAAGRCESERLREEVELASRGWSW